MVSRRLWSSAEQEHLGRNSFQQEPASQRLRSSLDSCRLCLLESLVAELLYGVHLFRGVRRHGPRFNPEPRELTDHSAARRAHESSGWLARALRSHGSTDRTALVFLETGQLLEQFLVLRGLLRRRHGRWAGRVASIISRWAGPAADPKSEFEDVWRGFSSGHPRCPRGEIAAWSGTAPRTSRGREENGSWGLFAGALRASDPLQQHERAEKGKRAPVCPAADGKVSSGCLARHGNELRMVF